MANTHSTTQLLEGFDEFCDRAFTPDTVPACNLEDEDDGEAPFPQLRSSREWIMAEASRLYSLSDPQTEHREFSPDARSSSLSQTSTRIEYDGLVDLIPGKSQEISKRRDSVFKDIGNSIRRLSNSMVEALPVRIPSFRRKKNRTFKRMEKWTWDQAQKSSAHRREKEETDPEIRRMAMELGSIC